MVSSVFLGDTLWGILALLPGRDREFNDIELSILNMVTNLLSNFLQNIKYSEEYYILYHTFSTLSESFVWMNIDGTFKIANTAFFQTFGSIKDVFELSAISPQKWQSVITALKATPKQVCKREFLLDNKNVEVSFIMCYVKYLENEFIFAHNII